MKYSKDEFFNYYFRLIDATAEKCVKSLSYKSFEEYFKYYLETLSLDWPSFNQDCGDNIKEIKATRNLLLHNDLIVNDNYLEQAGKQCRASSKGYRIKVDFLYVHDCIEVILNFENHLRSKILEKYKEYTKVSANRRLWSFMFHSPVLQYDDYWDVNEEKDSIFAMKQSRYVNNLSNSERLLLGLWRSHFNMSSKYLEGFNMRHFDPVHQEKIMFFLSIAPEFSFS
jgi:hypothetical protein